jgi:hypothetical protein
MLMLDPLYDMIMDVKSKCATIDMIDVNIRPVIFGVSIFSILMGTLTRTHRAQKTDAQMEDRDGINCGGGKSNFSSPKFNPNK